MTGYIIRKSIRKLPGWIIKLVPIPEPEIVSGFGTRSKSGEICKARGYTRALLVTDTTLSSLGYDVKVMDSLRTAGIEFRKFDKISTEPTCEVIEEGRKAALEINADCIIGLGGGSVMDSSKMIAACVRYKSISVSHLSLKFLIVRGKTLPLITIPSTAGTGAEMTIAAVITNTEKHRKSSTVIVGLNVKDIILDSELTLKMPRHVTAACGIDALSHAIEGIVSSVSSSREDVWKSHECVRLVLENLPKVLEKPDDVEARQKMCLAANYGGNAINRQLCGYVHAFAHSIGAKYHIPHGNAIAMSILPVLEAEMPYCMDKLAQAAQHCSLTQSRDSHSDAEKMIHAISELIDICNFAPHQPIPESDMDELTQMINADSINYSAPKTFKDKEIKAILRKI